jgi:general secretion pathway protein D
MISEYYLGNLCSCARSFGGIIRNGFKSRLFIALLFTVFLSSCGGNPAFNKGQKALAREDLDAAVRYYMEAVRHDPDNVRYRVSLNQALFNASNFHLRLGDDFSSQGDLKLALLEYQKSLEFNSENNDARRKKQSLLKRLEELRKRGEEKSDIERLKEKVSRVAAPVEKLVSPNIPLDLKLGDVDLKVLFKALQKSSSVKFLFDEAFQSKKVSVDFENVLFKDALEKILMQTRMFYKIIDSNTIIIIPDTPAKRREYDELTMKTFFLSNANPEELQKIITTVTGCKITAVNPGLNTITVRDRPQKVAMVERLLQIMDKPKAELLIDVEIIEANKSRMKEYGIELSQYNVLETFSPGALAAETASSFRGNRFSFVDSSDFVFQVPSISYKLLQGDSKSRIKAKPQLRVIDQETVKIRLGDKVPIVTTTFVPNYSAGTPNNQPITSFQMQDIGINIELTPRVHHDGWISIKLEFELTFITSPGTSVLPPTIGNRSVKTMIRLQDNETSLLAGLLRDTERNTLRGFPGLADLPILKHIFSSNKKEVDQTDIILTITPHIIKFPDIADSDLLNYWVGTEEDIGLKAPPPLSPFADITEGPAEKSSDEPVPKKEAIFPLLNQEKKAGQAEVKEKAPAPETFPGRLALVADSKSAVKGKPLEVRLIADGIDDLHTMALELAYAPAILQLSEISEGALCKGKGFKGRLFKSFDNAAGKIVISLALDEAERSNPKEIAILHFNAVNSGQVEIKASKTDLVDMQMRRIPALFTGTIVTVAEK